MARESAQGASRGRLVPKLFTVLREGYSGDQFVRDLTAGVIVGIVALPLAIAFANASGVKPEQGLYTAVVAGFLISALGGVGSRSEAPPAPSSSSSTASWRSTGTRGSPSRR